MNSIAPLVTTQDLSVIYDLGKSSQTTALDKVNIAIYPEEYVIFFGPSGCGKSTLLYAIAGLETPTYGRVLFQGKDLGTFSGTDMQKHVKENIGVIFQAFYLIPSLNALDNVVLPQIFNGIEDKERKAKGLDLLKRFGMQDQANRSPLSLSGGQQQRIAIARSLSNNPSLILADEPIGNLDSESARTVMGILQEINERDKKTIILVTHNPKHLLYAHRVYYMEDGKITQEVVNTEKKQKIHTESTTRVPSQLESLARLYPYLSKHELQAKVLVNYLLLPLTVENLERLESFIVRYIKGEIQIADLYRFLDMPYDKGGMGLYEQTARIYANQIQKLLAQSETLREHLMREQEKATQGRTEVAVKVERIRTILLDSYSGSVTPIQLQRLDQALKGRLLQSIGEKEFRYLLDAPVKKGGAGFNKRTAHNLTKLFEVILAESM